MEEDGKVFSDYDVDLSSGRNYFESVKLVEVGGATPATPAPPAPSGGNVFKIMLLNNNQFFTKDSGAEFRAQTDQASAAEYTFIPAEDEGTYYLQSVANPDEWVSFQTGGWYIREK